MKARKAPAARASKYRAKRRAQGRGDSEAMPTLDELRDRQCGRGWYEPDLATKAVAQPAHRQPDGRRG